MEIPCLIHNIIDVCIEWEWEKYKFVVCDWCEVWWLTISRHLSAELLVAAQPAASDTADPGHCIVLCLNMRQTLANSGNGSISGGSVHSAPSGGNRSRPAKHKARWQDNNMDVDTNFIMFQHNWDRRGSNVASTLGSTPRRNGGGSLVHQVEMDHLDWSSDNQIVSTLL